MKIKQALLVPAMLVLASCGPQHQAESAVEEFLQNNIADNSTLQISNYGDLDSTRYLNDSTISALQAQEEKSPIYNKGIKYADRKETQMLMFIRVTYNVNGKEHHDTYYLNKEMTEVIAIKSN